MGKIWRKGWLVIALGAMILTITVPAVAQQKVLVGLVTSLSGVYASIGQDQIRGSQYAADEIGGKVLGKPIELVPIDDEAKPGVGARKVREAIQSKGVNYLNGAVSSGVALAVVR